MVVSVIHSLYLKTSKLFKKKKSILWHFRAAGKLRWRYSCLQLGYLAQGSSFRTVLACVPYGTIPKNQSMFRSGPNYLGLKAWHPFHVSLLRGFCAPIPLTVIKSCPCLDLFPLKSSFRQHLKPRLRSFAGLSWFKQV